MDLRSSFVLRQVPTKPNTCDPESVNSFSSFRDRLHPTRPQDKTLPDISVVSAPFVQEALQGAYPVNTKHCSVPTNDTSKRTARVRKIGLSVCFVFVATRFVLSRKFEQTSKKRNLLASVPVGKNCTKYPFASSRLILRRFTVRVTQNCSRPSRRLLQWPQHQQSSHCHSVVNPLFLQLAATLTTPSSRLTRSAMGHATRISRFNARRMLLAPCAQIYDPRFFLSFK